MSSGAFLRKANTDPNDPRSLSIRWSTHDPQTMKNRSVSDELACFETLTGKRYSLIADAQKPWFKCGDSDGKFFYGTLVNSGAEKLSLPFKTDEIVRVTTIKGEIIDTILALVEPDIVPARNRTDPAGFRWYFAELIAGAIRTGKGGVFRGKPSSPAL